MMREERKSERRPAAPVIEAQLVPGQEAAPVHEEEKTFVRVETEHRVAQRSETSRNTRLPEQMSIQSDSVYWEDLRSLQTEVRKKRMELAEYKRRYVRAESETHNERLKAQLLEDELEKLRKELSSRHTRNFDSLESDNERLRTLLRFKQEENDKLTHENSALRDDIRKYSAQSRDMQLEFNRFKEQNDLMRHGLQQTLRDINSSSSPDSWSEKRHAEEQIRHLQTQISELKEYYEREIGTKDRDISRLQAKLTDTEHSLQEHIRQLHANIKLRDNLNVQVLQGTHITPAIQQNTIPVMFAEPECAPTLDLSRGLFDNDLYPPPKTEDKNLSKDASQLFKDTTENSLFPNQLPGTSTEIDAAPPKEWGNKPVSSLFDDQDNSSFLEVFATKQPEHASIKHRYSKDHKQNINAPRNPMNTPIVPFTKTAPKVNENPIEAFERTPETEPVPPKRNEMSQDSRTNAIDFFNNPDGFSAVDFFNSSSTSEQHNNQGYPTIPSSLFD